VRLESNFSAVILSIGVIEGLGIQLDPDADIVMRAAPYILRTAARDYGLL
jgi:predicted unusual protein kinase regulating ubiquinone biosynthesis (AarF/ABC1/UbiB family)